MDSRGPITFEQVVTLEKTGRLIVGIDRVFARRFYTDVSLRSVKEQTGEAPYLEKALVLCSFIGAPVILIVTAAFAISALGWWSLLAIPVGVFLWGGLVRCIVPRDSTTHGLVLGGSCVSGSVLARRSGFPGGLGPRGTVRRGPLAGALCVHWLNLLPAEFHPSESKGI